MLLLKNGRVIDPVTKVDKIQDVLIDGNQIIKLGTNLSAPDAKLLDCGGLIIAPGLMDAHVHFRDPGYTDKEDLWTGAAAAAKGGFTTVVCMANTNPVVDHREILTAIQKKAETAKIHILQASAISKGLKGKELVDMEAMAAAKAPGFTDDGIPLLDEALLLEAMKKAKELNLPLSLHEEHPLFVQAAGVHKGSVSEKLGYGGADRTAEDLMVARDCILALHTGASVCIQHISSKNSVELVRLAKRMGADIHAEATPHHFTLTEDAVLTYGTLARMNPPVRTEEDRQAIIEGLKDGTIDMIVTDHAPHTTEEKARPLESAPSGITGLETSLALGIDSLVAKGHLSLMELLALMSENPARFYRRTPASIQEKAVADIVIFSEQERWIPHTFASKASNTPFKDWTLPGKIYYTICEGNIVYSL